MFFNVLQLRKAAQKGLISMLREGIGINNCDFHPSCSLVTKHCKYVIEKGGQLQCTCVYE